MDWFIIRNESSLEEIFNASSQKTWSKGIYIENRHVEYLKIGETTFIIRASHGDELSAERKNNTVVELYKIGIEAKVASLILSIDKSTLNMESFSLNDFVAYDSNLFLVSMNSMILRMKFESEDSLNFTLKE